MDYYQLKEDEVILYKGEVVLPEKDGSTQLVLTNHNLVFKTKNEREVDIDIFAVSDIKFYEGVPQIKAKSNNIEIYFLLKEKEFTFLSKIEAHKFLTTAKKLLTGKSTAERCMDKVKYSIDKINDEFNIDIVDLTVNAVNNGVAGAVKGTFKGVASLINKKK
ncbi:MAG: hypothetical protein IJ301_03295 [Clostridia bacterium]|nr:hypothetical protein [Clostridia bacterium]